MLAFAFLVAREMSKAFSSHNCNCVWIHGKCHRTSIMRWINVGIFSHSFMHHIHKIWGWKWCVNWVIAPRRGTCIREGNHAIKTLHYLLLFIELLGALQNLNPNFLKFLLSHRRSKYLVSHLSSLYISRTIKVLYICYVNWSMFIHPKMVLSNEFGNAFQCSSFTCVRFIRVSFT